MAVFRFRADGTPGCTVPCVWCARELLRYDLRVSCTTGAGAVFSGRLDAADAPAALLTAGQRRMLGRDETAADRRRRLSPPAVA
jgi:hypothetical protein